MSLKSKQFKDATDVKNCWSFPSLRIPKSQSLLHNSKLKPFYHRQSLQRVRFASTLNQIWARYLKGGSISTKIGENQVNPDFSWLSWKILKDWDGPSQKFRIDQDGLSQPILKFGRDRSGRPILTRPNFWDKSGWPWLLWKAVPGFASILI